MNAEQLRGAYRWRGMPDDTLALISKVSLSSVKRFWRGESWNSKSALKIRKALKGLGYEVE